MLYIEEKQTEVNSMKKGVVVAGYADLDLIKTITAFPRRHGLVAMTGVQKAHGGAACNCTLDMARLEPETTVFPLAVLGEDDYGEALLRRLSAPANVDTRLIRRLGETGFTDVLDEADTRVRTFICFRGANRLLSEEMIDPAALDCDLFHIGYILLLDALDAPDAEYGTKMARLLDKLQRAGIATSVDVITDDSGLHRKLVPPALRYTDYLTINEHEAAATCGVPLRDADDQLILANMERALRELKAMGVRRWVCVHAPEGAFGLDEAGRYAVVPGARLPEGFIQGTVGAGDAFVSGLLLAARRGEALETAMEDGIAAAVCSLTQADASAGVRPIAEARALLATLPRREI